MVQCTIDNDLLFSHKKINNEQILFAINCIHVDDLQLAGRRDVIIWISQQIEHAFGQLNRLAQLIQLWSASLPTRRYH